MFTGHYTDFDDMFYLFNQEFLLNPGIIDVTLSDSGYVDNVVIQCDNYNCTLDLATFGYKKNKWGHLLHTYIDYEQLLVFKENLGKVSGMAYTFYFNRKKVNNGSCLIAITLTRRNRNAKWNRAKVFYRVTETQRRMAADLVMLNRFFTELPEDICEVENVTFFMAQAYCSAKFIHGFYEYFDVPIEDLDESYQWIKQLKKDYNSFFTEGAKIHSFQTLARMQKLHFGLDEYPPLPIEKLSIKKFFEEELQKKGKKI